MRDGDVRVGPGEVVVVSEGGERCLAKTEAHLLPIEPTGTPNTGDATTAAPRRAI